MRNPFKNTQDYMIVREFNRLNSKKRSNSSSSDSSLWSSQSSKMSGYNNVKRDTGSSSTYQKQYLILKNKPNLHQIQSKRAQVFGIQQLRYKPTYFENFQYSSSEAKEQEKKQVTEKKIIQPSLKSQKSIKKFKFPNQSRKQISEKRVQIQDKIQQKLQQIQLNSNRQSFSKKRRGSIVEEMIQLNMDNGGRSNQFYSSIGDLKSKHEIIKSSSNVYASNHKCRNKKSSIFYNQQQGFDYKELVKFRNSQEIYEQSQKSRFSESRRIQQTEIYTNNNVKQNQIPETITVRNRVYYKYSK